MQYPPIPKHCDKRRNLTDEDKEDIRKMKDDFSTRQLAAKFGVSRRTIQFILDPHKLKANLARRRERIERGERQETSEARRIYMQRFRQHQKEVNGNLYQEYERKTKEQARKDTKAYRERKRNETT